MRRALLALCLTACAPQTSPTPTEQPATPEPTTTPLVVDDEPLLLGMMQANDGLTLQLQSGGCRDKSDFGLGVVANALAFTKLDNDQCRAEIPLGANVSFAWSELPEFATFGFAPGDMPVLEPATTPGPTTTIEGAIDEWLYGVLVTSDGIDVRVFTGGCTGAADFTAWIEPGDIDLVHLVRTRIDGCEAEIPEGVLLHFTWAQLGVTDHRARLANQIVKLPLK